MKLWLPVILILLAVLILPSLSSRGPEVVVYTALDSVFSRKIFAQFEAETGIRVKAVYDTEATKTAGLVDRLRREAAAPRCDVFWNNEICRTVLLGREGVLEPYSPAAGE